MPLKNTSPDAGALYVNVQRLEQGGTGAATAQQALQNLNGVTLGQLGQPNGPVLLDGTGALYPEYLEDLSLTDVAVDGDLNILVGESKDFFLTTYDGFSEYELEAVMGSVARSENVIRYTAGNTPGLGGFFINGRQIFVNIVGQRVETPVILAPVNATEDASFALTVLTSEFSTSGAPDFHLSTDWELSTDPTFQNAVVVNHDDSLNLTSWGISDLEELTKYYVRARYRGTSIGLSEWSTPVSFTTGNDGAINTETGLFQPYVAFGYASEAKLLAIFSVNPAPATYNSIKFYQRNGNSWTFVEEVNLPQTKSYNNGARCVELTSDGLMMIVGAIGDGLTASDARVYYFRKIDGVWTHKQTLSNPYTTTTWGASGAIAKTGSAPNGDAVLAISAYYADYSTYDGSGQVRLYTLSNDVWSLTETKNGGSAEYGAYGLGVAFSKDGSVLSISRPFHNHAGTYGGQIADVRTYFRSGSTWPLQSGLTITRPISGRMFGYRIALNEAGTKLAAAIPNKSTSPVDNTVKGLIYLYDRSSGSWVLERTLQASFSYAPDMLGTRLSLSTDPDPILIAAYGSSGVPDEDKGLLIFQ